MHQSTITNTDLSVESLNGIAVERYSEQNGLIGLKLFPLDEVEKHSGSYAVLDEKSIMKGTKNTKVTADSAIKQVTFTFKDALYKTQLSRLKTVITAEEVAKYSSRFNAEVVGLQTLIIDQMRSAELNAKAKIDEILTAHTVATAWDNSAAKPNQVVQSFQSSHFGTKVSSRANACVMSEKVFNEIINSDYFNSQNKHIGGIQTIDQLKDAVAVWFRIPPMNFTIVGIDALKDGNGEGLAVNASSIWGDDFALFFVTTRGPFNGQPCFGKTLRWGEFDSTDVNGAPDIYDGFDDHGNRTIYAQKHRSEHVVSANCAYLLDGLLT